MAVTRCSKWNKVKVWLLLLIDIRFLTFQLYIGQVQACEFNSKMKLI